MEYTRNNVNFHLGNLKYRTQLFTKAVLSERGWKDLSIEEMEKVLEEEPYYSDVGFVRSVVQREKEEIKLLEEDVGKAEKGGNGDFIRRLEKVIEDIRKVKSPAKKYIERRSRYDRIRGYDPRKDKVFLHFSDYVEALTHYGSVIQEWIEHHRE